MKQLRKSVQQSFKQYCSLSDDECMITFLELLRIHWKYDQERFHCALGVSDEKYGVFHEFRKSTGSLITFKGHRGGAGLYVLHFSVSRHYDGVYLFTITIFPSQPQRRSATHLLQLLVWWAESAHPLHVRLLRLKPPPTACVSCQCVPWLDSNQTLT